ncbi:hypothetical protein RIF29_20881 [Crotalaria pallida]|uniref:Uncharacterized protein n=1 Tax=Crotalaria pallida TaxID=3830 RepID=A0AAN9F4B0_CROPI
MDKAVEACNKVIQGNQPEGYVQSNDPVQKGGTVMEQGSDSIQNTVKGHKDVGATQSSSPSNSKEDTDNGGQWTPVKTRSKAQLRGWAKEFSGSKLVQISKKLNALRTDFNKLNKSSYADILKQEQELKEKAKPSIVVDSSEIKDDTGNKIVQSPGGHSYVPPAVEDVHVYKVVRKIVKLAFRLQRIHPIKPSDNRLHRDMFY